MRQPRPRASSTTRCWKSIPIASTRVRFGEPQTPPKRKHEDQETGSLKEINMAKDTHVTAPTRFVEANGIGYAYRRFGSESGTPLIFLQHFRGGLDNWD